MENIEKAENTTNTTVETPINNKKKGNSLFLILIIVLFIGILGMGYLFINQKNISSEALAQVDTLSLQKESLSKEIASLLNSINIHEKNNEALNEELQIIKAQLEETQLNLQNELKNGDAAQLRSYKEQLSQAKRKINSLYEEIAQLKNQNSVLEGEKLGLAQELNTSRSKNQVLVDENLNLNEKVRLGSLLNAYEINITGVKVKGTKEKVYTKAKKVEKLKITYKIGKNILANNGEKTAYLRIITPSENVLLQDSETPKFIAKEQELIYSVKQDFLYEGADVPMSIYFSPITDLEIGNYRVEIYYSQELIGIGRMELTK